ncbi:diguanylate cyclase domain-containing protein [Aureimonas phyllosphaerae]|uniref:Diguanylate cyclase (GGDEF)-like protein n=1 Tax=Aureimonas phyllosphaerae TaxID=1166078 RepID=A0A7W6BU86_9HYPH|nr:diguanylate cyclase [Aureimonas phyllosphaerae]MBB3936144.1 diguanylate cyclase (GGDEF)-like protein [Aureimonas phyllosphaerae]MBB3960131.1 diguanylate cyclase (GGDEF)-like protein [Aureimonas phyllosphaerae]SFF33588.1 diguanylate cyclase (GGDEF) domain-containing protein [Aureimonas phyllosphaerae]
MIASQKAYTHLVRRVLLPMIGLVALLLVGLLAAVWVVAAHQTSAAVGEEIRLVRSALAMRGEYMRKIALDYGTWDEAYQNLVAEPDAAWSDENIGFWSSSHYGFDMALVVGPDGEAEYIADHGERVSSSMSAMLPDGADAIVRAAVLPTGEGAASGLLLSDAGPAIAAAAIIRRGEHDQPAEAERHVLILVDVLDDKTLAQFERAYPLAHLRLETPSFAAAASAAIVDDEGRTIARLAWDGERPGDDLLRVAIPIWLAVAAAFGLLIWTGTGQVRSSTRIVAASVHRATHDALTDLPNRVLLFERLDAAARALGEGGAPFAVAYLDLDGFKAVNDRHGHAEGDRVLCAVAARLRDLVAAERDTVARLGGDEFALLLFSGRGDRGRLDGLARRFIAAIETPIALGNGVEASVSATVGLSLAPGDSSDPLALLRQADEALYAGKRAGKRRALFHDSVERGLAPAA